MICRLMASGGVAAGDGLQLWIYTELLEPHVGASGLDMGHRLPVCCGTVHCIC